MAKRLRVPPSTVAYIERKLACVDEARSHPPSAADLAELLEDMRSPDEQTRARAVRDVCPCRMPWNVFSQARTAVKRLQHDPSPLVRANALHVAEDAREIAALEALREWLAEHQERMQESASWPERRGKRWRAGNGRRMPPRSEH